MIGRWLIYAEVNRGVLPRSDHSLGWKSALVNLAGSAAFGVSAIAARYLSTTGMSADIALINVSTFFGAACFFVGAAMLPAEARTETAG